MIFQLKDVTYAYPQSESNALEGINLSVSKGEYIAVAGANGSGKSTLARLIAGLIKQDSGSFYMDEYQLNGIVFQQPKEQIVAGIVERDTAFGPQNLDMSHGEIELRTLECLSSVGLVDKAFARTFQLSLGQTQRLAFAGILALFPDVLILDEATAMLDPANRKIILSIADGWHRKGHTVITVTHDKDEVFRAERVLVLEKGRLIFDGKSSDFRKKRSLVNSIFLSDSFYTKKSSDTKSSSGKNTTAAKNTKPRARKNAAAVKIENLSFAYGNNQVFSNLSLELESGTLTALTGPSGCGKSTLMECMAGILEPQSGTILCRERPLLALQESEAALFENFAADDVAFGPSNKGVGGKTLLETVKNSMALAGIPYETFGNRQTTQMSGGEKKKLSIAGIIAMGGQILLFDEPTAGLDPSSRQNIMTTMRSLADQGKTVLFSTHRMEEAQFADKNIQWSELAGAVSGSTKNKKSGGTENARNTTSRQAAKKQKETDLEPVKPLENAKILDSLSSVSAIFMAPSKIPVSPVGILPPGLKYVLFLAIFIASMVVKSWWLCLVMLAVSMVYAICGRVSLKKPLKAFLKLLPWLLIFALFEFWFLPVEEGEAVFFKAGWFSISPSKIKTVVSSLIRVLAQITSIATFLYTTPERDILDGLDQLLTPLKWLHIPVRYAVLVAGIIFRFIPLLMETTSSIIKTQLIRGGLGTVKGFKKIKVLLPLFIPMLIQTLRKSEMLSDALTARYFS